MKKISIPENFRGCQYGVTGHCLKCAIGKELALKINYSCSGFTKAMANKDIYIADKGEKLYTQDDIDKAQKPYREAIASIQGLSNAGLSYLQRIKGT